MAVVGEDLPFKYVFWLNKTSIFLIWGVLQHVFFKEMLFYYLLFINANLVLDETDEHLNFRCI